MGFLAVVGILLLIITGVTVFVRRAGEGMLGTLLILIGCLVAATLILALTLSIIFYAGVVVAFVVGWAWSFSVSLWDASAVIRRFVLAPYYRRRATREASRLLKIHLTLEAKIAFVRAQWESLQRNLAEADRAFSSEHLSFELLKEFEELSKRCHSTVPRYILAEQWDEAGTTLKQLLSELDRLVRRREDFRAKIPRLRASWDHVTAHAKRLVDEAMMLDLPPASIVDLRELAGAIRHHGQGQLDEEDWDGLEQTLSAAEEGLAAHDHLSRLLSELELDRNGLNKNALSYAYKRMAKLHHPDLGASGCHERMARINEAKQLLENFLTLKSKVA